jgi:hypothetical protein
VLPRDYDAGQRPDVILSSLEAGEGRVWRSRSFEMVKRSDARCLHESSTTAPRNCATKAAAA